MPEQSQTNKTTTRELAPVVFMIFNRPEPTSRVFAEIRKAQPRKLFIIADGPRNEAERARCEATRQVVETIDWECDVIRHYSEVNLGCKNRISSGITLVFSQVEEAIFLEDDCLPHPDFFTFATEMLTRYKDDTRVMHISGDNFQQKNPSYAKHLTGDYYFSRIPHVWGWATWRRAWDLYDVDVQKFPEVRDTKSLANILPNEAVRLHWEHVFAQYYAGTISSWDGQWVFCCLTHNGLCIMPRVNMIENIGFTSDATHPKDLTAAYLFIDIPASPLPSPYTEPAKIAANEALDAYSFKYIFGVNRFFSQQILSFARSHFPKTYALLRKEYRNLKKS